MSRSSSSRPAIAATAAVVAGVERGSERGAGDIAEAAGAGLQIGFQLLLDGGVSELVDVGGRRPGARSRPNRPASAQHRADPQGKQQILGFEASRH